MVVKEVREEVNPLRVMGINLEVVVETGVYSVMEVMKVQEEEILTKKMKISMEEK